MLEGSVRKAGTNLRINVQLIDAASDSQLWSHKFSGATDDIFGVQEAIAREIARALDLTLSSAEDRSLSARSFRDVRTYDLYLQARALMWRFDNKSTTEAHPLLTKAQELEGENAALLALTGHMLISTLVFGLSTDTSLRRQVSDLAARIIEIVPDSADGHYLMGMLAYDSGDLQGANHRLKQALACNRNHTESLAWIANVCLHAGRTDATRIWADALRAVDPLATFGWVPAAFAESFDGRFARGVELMARAVELQSGGLFPRWQSGYSFALKGDLTEAARQWHANGSPRRFRCSSTATSRSISRKLTLSQEIRSKRSRW